jgi:hypothetical protein
MEQREDSRLSGAQLLRSLAFRGIFPKGSLRIDGVRDRSVEVGIALTIGAQTLESRPFKTSTRGLKVCPGLSPNSPQLVNLLILLAFCLRRGWLKVGRSWRGLSGSVPNLYTLSPPGFRSAPRGGGPMDLLPGEAALKRRSPAPLSTALSRVGLAVVQEAREAATALPAPPTSRPVLLTRPDDAKLPSDPVAPTKYRDEIHLPPRDFDGDLRGRPGADAES